MHCRDDSGEADGIQGVDSGKRASQVIVEQSLVAEHRHDLALAQCGNPTDDLVAQTRQFGIMCKVREHVLGCLAHSQPRIGVPLGEEGAQFIQQDLVIGEDDVFLAAELAKERRAGDPCGLRDLLDRGLIETLRLEQL